MHNVAVYTVRPKIYYLVLFVLLSVAYYIAANANDTYAFCSDRLIIYLGSMV